MKIFLSYGHDSNAPLIEKIKEYLTKDGKGTCSHGSSLHVRSVKKQNYKFKQYGAT